MSANVAKHRWIEDQVAEKIDLPTPETTVAPSIKRVVEKLLPYTLSPLTFTVDHRATAKVEVSLTDTNAAPLLTIGTTITRTVTRTTRDGHKYDEDVVTHYVISVRLQVSYFKTLDASDYYLGKSCLCKIKYLLDTNGKLGIEERLTMNKWIVALK